MLNPVLMQSQIEIIIFFKKELPLTQGCQTLLHSGPHTAHFDLRWAGLKIKGKLPFLSVYGGLTAL